MPELQDPQTAAREAETNSAKLEDLLGSDAFAEHLRQILPAHLETDRFATIALRTFRRSPELAQCTLASVASAIMEAAALGLEIGLNGECWLVPRRMKHGDGYVWEAQLDIGYLGHLALAYRSEKVAAVQVDAVMKGDAFEFQQGTSGFLHHRPRKGRELSGAELEYAYAIIETTFGGKVWRVLDRTAIERLRNSGASANSPAWRNWYPEMAMAKALKNALKLAPKSREMARAVALADAIEADVPQTFTTPLALPETVTTTSERVKRALDPQPVDVQPQPSAAPAQRRQQAKPQPRKAKPLPDEPPPVVHVDEEGEPVTVQGAPPPSPPGEPTNDLGW